MKASFISVAALVFSLSTAYGTPLAPDDPGYERQPAKDKYQVLLKMIQESPYETLPEWQYWDVLEILPKALNPGNYFKKSVEYNSDLTPDNRKKLIHKYGSAVGVAFDADPDSPFTGLYQGVSYGIARLSVAAQPTDSIIPGIAVKFLVDGAPSGNFVAMHSLDGQRDFNFFAKDFSTFIDPPKDWALKLLGNAFATASIDQTKVDAAYMAAFDQFGQTVPAPVAPDRLVLKPNREVLHFSSESHDFRLDLAGIPEGTLLYEVYGAYQNSSELKKIGTLTTTSRFVSSQFEDERLFFRHQRYHNQ